MLKRPSGKVDCWLACPWLFAGGRLEGPATGGTSIPSICDMTDSVPCGVARVEGLVFKAWMTLWWSSFAAFPGVLGFAALVILPCRSSAVVEEGLVCVSMGNWLLVGWLAAPSAGGVGESLFNSLINLVVVAVALCASSEEGVGDVFITLGSEMLLSLITHCKMSQLSKKFSGWLGDSPASS